MVLTENDSIMSLKEHYSLFIGVKYRHIEIVGAP